MSNYWTATDDYLCGNGGVGPICSGCGRPKTPDSDHGTFTCIMCDVFGRGTVRRMDLGKVKPNNNDSVGEPPLSQDVQAQPQSRVQGEDGYLQDIRPPSFLRVFILMKGLMGSPPTPSAVQDFQSTVYTIPSYLWVF